MANRLSGAGMMPSHPSTLTGPPAALQGTLGAAPQASTPPNMLSGAGASANPGGTPSAPGMSNMLAGPGASPQQPALQPPSKEQLIESAHKTAYVNSVLKELMSKPNLSARDVINAVGEMISEGIMDPFMAGKYLADLPSDTIDIRQWVSQHFATSQQTLRTLGQMIAASGRQSRRIAMTSQAPGVGQPQMPSPQMMPPPNVLNAAPRNMLSGMH